jgi:hypothetical protein
LGKNHIRVAVVDDIEQSEFVPFNNSDIARIENIVKAPIGRKIVNVRYIIESEWRMPQISEGLHMPEDFVVFDLDDGSQYCAYWEHINGYHTLLFTPIDHFKHRMGSMKIRFEQSAFLDISKLESWSIYMGKKIEDISLGWGEDSYSFSRVNSILAPSIYWIKMSFEGDLMIVMTTGHEMWRQSKVGDLIAIEAPGSKEKRYFGPSPEDVCIIFDQYIAEKTTHNFHTVKTYSD